MFWRVFSAICFWLLTIIAFAMFAIAVLMPQIQEYRGLRQIESEIAGNQQKILEVIEKNENEIRQLRERDPYYTREVAQDLGYKPPGRPVPLSTEVGSSPQAPEASSTFDDDLRLSARNDTVGRTVGPLADVEWLELAREPRMRLWMLIIAGVSITLAVLLFAGRRKPQLTARRR